MKSWRRFENTCENSIVFFAIQKISRRTVFLFSIQIAIVYMGFEALELAVPEIEVIFGCDLSWGREIVSAQSGASSIHPFFRFISIFIQTTIVYTHSTRLAELISDHLILFRSDQK